MGVYTDPRQLFEAVTNCHRDYVCFYLVYLFLLNLVFCYSLQVLVLALLLYFYHLIFITFSRVISLFTLPSQAHVLLITTLQLLDLFHFINFTCSQLLSTFLITTTYMYMYSDLTMGYFKLSCWGLTGASWTRTRGLGQSQVGSTVTKICPL